MKKALTLSILLAAQVAAMAQTTKVQVIHNCADAAADSVDVYLGSTKLLDNFAFRTATPFIDAPAGVPLTLGVAPKNSTSVSDTIFSVSVTLSASNSYILVANGIVSPTGYTPSASVAPFRLSVYDMARLTASTAGNTDILVVHGSTDAPTVDVKAGSATLVNDISFGEFCSTGYLSVPVANDTLDVTNSAGTTIVKRYSAPLSTLNLGDSAITVLASGFLDPAANSSGPSFGLWVALRQGGNLVPLPELTVPTGVNNISKENIEVYPNPTSGVIRIASGTNISKMLVTDITGKTIKELSDFTTAEVSLSEYPAGVYMVTCVSADGSVKNIKCIKN